MADKQKDVRYTTPRGTAQYPRILGEPDTKFNPAGVWSIKVVFDLSDVKVAEMVKRFEDTIAEAKNNARADETYMSNLKKRKKTLTEADRSFVVDEDAGTVTVNFKMTASGTSKKTGKAWSMRPTVFTPDGNLASPETRVGSGSTVQVSYTCAPFYTAVGYGCSIRLNGVVIRKLVEWGMGSAASHGFEFDNDDEPTDEATEEAVEANEPDANDDF